MPGVRINQLLASTAVVLLLAGAPAVTLAGPNDGGANAAATAPIPADADKTPAAIATPQPLDSPDLPATTGSTASTQPSAATAEPTPAAAAAPATTPEPTTTA